MRRAGHDALSKTQVAEYEPIQERQAIILVDEFLKNKGNWETLFLR